MTENAYNNIWDIVMSARRRKRNKKWLKWVIFLVLVIIAAVISYFVWDGYFRNKGESNPTPIQNDSEVKVAKKETGTDDEKKQPVREASEKEKVVQYEGSDPNERAEETGVLSGAVTYAGVSGGRLMVRVNIDQYLGSGTCILTLRQGGANVYSETAPIVDAASTATCEGFDVTTSGLSNGETEIIVYVSSGEKSGEIHGGVTL